MNGRNDKTAHRLVVTENNGVSFAGHVEDSEGVKVHVVEGTSSSALDDPDYLPTLTQQLVSSGHIPEGSTIDRTA